jgi:hypothetical protein
MRKLSPRGIAMLCIVAPLLATRAQADQDGLYFPSAVTQTETDEYTHYELRSPESSSFKIYYEVTATTAGARYFYNPICKGRVASDESVFDAMLGTPLKFEVVSAAQARKDPLMHDAELGDVLLKAKRRIG